jgi:uncharacterized protein YdeI (YjbR/CyaY-like superfamily)
MGKTDPRIDQYIAKSADFAKPILTHIRRVVHDACPDVVETMKWSSPHFGYKGMMCGMAAFKSHCAFGFWKAALVLDNPAADEGMGSFGKITSIKDLPAEKKLAAYIKKAAKLNDDGVKVARGAAARKKPIKMPADFAGALKKNKPAQRTFDAFSPSHKREYLEWITEAKTDATRHRRMATAIDWLAEGKPRNWKYMPR